MWTTEESQPRCAKAARFPAHLRGLALLLGVAALVGAVARPAPAQEGVQGDATRATVGRLVRVVDAVPLRGEEIRLRIALRARLPEVPTSRVSGGGCDPGACAWIRIDGPPAEGPGSELRTPPVASETWTVEELRTSVPANALEIQFGIMLAGPGTMWADDLQLARREPDGTWRRLRVENADCETVLEGGRPAAWGGIEVPYRARIDRDGPYEGSGAIRIDRIAPGPDDEERRP
jgi:hypothetical protein